jgi:hypothetical protein
MKKLIGILAIASSLTCYAGQRPPYPAGIWSGQLTVGCGPLCSPGGLIKGGTQVTMSPVDEYGGDVEGSPCAIKQAVGGSVATLKSPTTLQWAINTPLIKSTYLLTLSPSYDSPSSLKRLTGYWNTNSFNARGLGNVYTEIVLPTGAFDSYDQYLGCVASGQYTVVDPKHNLYGLSETLYDCLPTAPKSFNGLRLVGIATLGKEAGATVLYKQYTWGTAAVVESSGDDFYYGD